MKDLGLWNLIILDEGDYAGIAHYGKRKLRMAGLSLVLQQGRKPRAKNFAKRDFTRIGFFFIHSIAWRISSAGERLPYKQDVTSSILVSSRRGLLQGSLFFFQ